MPTFFQNNDKNDTPLMMAIKNNESLDKISTLLNENKSDLDKLNSDNESALYIAIREGRCDVVRLLLTNKADMRAGRLITMPPLQVAVCYAREDIILMLLKEFHVDINEQSKGIKEDGITSGHTAIMHAAYSINMNKNGLDIVKLLLTFPNVNLHLKCESGETVFDTTMRTAELYPNSWKDRCCINLLNTYDEANNPRHTNVYERRYR